MGLNIWICYETNCNSLLWNRFYVPSSRSGINTFLGNIHITVKTILEYFCNDHDEDDASHAVFQGSLWIQCWCLHLYSLDHFFSELSSTDWTLMVHLSLFIFEQQLHLSNCWWVLPLSGWNVYFLFLCFLPLWFERDDRQSLLEITGFGNKRVPKRVTITQ